MAASRLSVKGKSAYTNINCRNFKSGGSLNSLSYCALYLLGGSADLAANIEKYRNINAKTVVLSNLNIYTMSATFFTTEKSCDFFDSADTCYAGNSLNLKSRLGSGTTITVWLPVEGPSDA